MANKVYLIDEAYLKANTTINLNVEESLLNNSILDAQEIRLQPLLGTKLYQKLLADVQGTPSGVYKTLLDDYCLKVVAYWAWFESLPFIRYKAMNKGVQSQNSANSVPVELDELKFLTDKISNKAQFYSQRLVDYLCANMSLFPEYSQNTTIADIQPVDTDFDCGIYLGNSSNYNRFLGKNNGIVPLY